MPAPYLGYQPHILVIRLDDAPLDVYSLQGMPKFMANWYSQFISMDGVCSLPLCAPSRAAGLTGKTVIRHGVIGNLAGDMMDREDTFLHAARNAGMYTAAVGKYINPLEGNATAFPNTDNLGCCTRYVYAGDPDYYSYSVFESINAGTAATIAYGATEADYATDVEGARVLEVLQRPMKLSKCIYWAPKTPHRGSSAGAIPANRHLAASVTLTPSASYGLDPALYGGTPWMIDAARGWDAAEIAAVDAEHIAAHRSLLSFDDWLDTILTYMQSSGMLAKSVIMLGTDNAHAYGEMRFRDKGTNHISASSMTWLVRAPNGVGGSRTQSVADYDIAPTVAALAGGTLKRSPDGMNFWPVVENASAVFRSGVLLYNPSKDSPRFQGLWTRNGPGGLPWSSGFGVAGGSAEGETWGWNDAEMIQNVGPEPGALAAAQRIIDSMAPLSVLVL